MGSGRENERRRKFLHFFFDLGISCVMRLSTRREYVLQMNAFSDALPEPDQSRLLLLSLADKGPLHVFNVVHQF